MKDSFELNLDGLPGPTHHYGGLSYGNLASMEGALKVSNPKKAALESLAKMRMLSKRGIPQGVLPPHERPFVPILKAMGFYGSEVEILQKVWNHSPEMLLSVSSSAAMWSANAATVSPSADSLDQRVHFTPANLISKFHRSFEFATSGLLLFKLFNDPLHFAHHPPLPLQADYADEGAANHLRLCSRYGEKGVQLFVYGRYASLASSTQKFPPRQTFEASQALARLHHLDPECALFAKQNPEAIDAGVFHNDVICLSNQNLFLCHEKAFLESDCLLEKIQKSFETFCQDSLICLVIKEEELSLKEAVKRYFFNSQLVTTSPGEMLLICPKECESSEAVKKIIEKFIEQKKNPIKEVVYQDLRQSMQNGGGPACLRLRVPLKNQELSKVHPGILFNEKLDEKLTKWIEKYYRDQLHPRDLVDPDLLKESYQALDALTAILKLGSIYPFQRLQQPPKLPEMN